VVSRRACHPPRRPAASLAVAGCAVSAVLVSLAGCSSATTTHARPVPSPAAPTGELAKPAKAILADARRELLAARSVRVSGTFSAAKAASSTRERIDLQLGRGVNGEALATGTVTTTVSASGRANAVPVALVRVAGTLYIRGDRDYYARIDPRVASAAGQWLSLPVGQDRSLSDLTDVTRLAEGLASPTASTAGELKLGSQQAIVIRAGGAIAYVAAGGTPRLLRLQRPAGNVLAGSLDFTGYGAALTVRPPARSVALQSLLDGPSG
jgi:hypothetical protein